MAATLLDGKALAEKIRAEIAAEVCEFTRRTRREAVPGRGPGGRRSGQPGLCPQQAEGLRAERADQPSAPAGGRDDDR